jgi:threonyl-tRNA synthetase
VTGREETVSTNQLDFAVPERMDLSYVGPDGTGAPALHHPPRAAGTHERFIAFLIEHYGGAFPTWLAPVQVRVVTVGERFDAYGAKLAASCAGRLRARRDRRPTTTPWARRSATQ